MQKNRNLLSAVLFFFCLQNIFAQHAINHLIPANTATHTAVNTGDWFEEDTWDIKKVPGDGAIVVIPATVQVTYEGQSTAALFAIRVDGEFLCTQTNSADTTKIIVDTFTGTMNSKIQFHAAGPTHGSIEILIKPFPIEAHKNGTSGYDQVWNADALAKYSDGAVHYEVTYDIGPDKRFKTFAAAQAGNTSVTELSRTAVDDGTGVLGRTAWDATQLSLGLISMGEVEIIGQEKSVMAKLSADALKNDEALQLVNMPTGWEVGDSILVTKGGNSDASNNGTELVNISSMTGKTIQLGSKLKKNHEGRMTDDLHCYVGNLNRNIVFKSAHPTVITQRGHLLVMHNPTNIQIKNAAFIDMGRTDKSKRTDDLLWSEWLEPPTFNSYVSALGQECVQLASPPAADISNHRGRYSIHLHQVGAAFGTQMAEVTGNLVRGNPGWAITHHDSHANVSDNFVYDVIGAGIVSEAGNETGFWDNNLIVDIKNGDKSDVYESAIFYDHYLYSGQGLGMKGRGVVCRGNVIVQANMGVGVVNFNSAINNTLRMDAAALANLRPDFTIDQFPLSINEYSQEGDGIMPLEVALILEHTTVIDAVYGLSSIERDMGVNHESRSVFNDLKIWGARTGARITYQNDYSFRNLFISGKNDQSIGLFMWKHAHNHSFDGIKLVDLKEGITVSKLVENQSAGTAKTRNNGVTPWLFLDLEMENVTNLYGIHLDDDASTTLYEEHPDNPIHLTAAQLSMTRPVTFTLNNQADLEIDPLAGDLRFVVDGAVTDRIGAYEFGIEQAASMDNLRADYPGRIYEFASQAKLEEYLVANGIYKDEENGDQLYFIIEELVPDRITYEYKAFPIRVKILNAPATAPYLNPQVESAIALAPKNQLISRTGTASQSSDNPNVSYLGKNISTLADKAIDGNSNGRKIAQFYQFDLLDIGSIAVTDEEQEPWWELDLGEEKIIEYIDIWNTVEMNGTAEEMPAAHFKDFYVLIGDAPFGQVSLDTARAHANYEYYQGQNLTRVFSLNDLNVKGRYLRIQANGFTKMGLAEVDVIGRSLSAEPDCAGVANGLAYIDNCADCVMGTTAAAPCALNEDYVWTKSSGTVLPVELIYFTGHLENEQTVLHWESALEESIVSYEIERSANAFDWRKLTTVPANNRPSQYSAIDHRPLSNQSYYRLKIVERDGTFSYSNRITILRNDQTAIFLYPNPAQEAVTLEFETAPFSNNQIAVVDVLGKRWIEKNVLSFGETKMIVPISINNLPSGTYYVEIRSKGKVRTKILLVTKG